MSTDPLPLMLDASMDGISGGLEDIDVDDVDLFGGSVVDLSLPTHLPPLLVAHPPPSKALQLRVDEQRGRGCSQHIDWSRQGTIASIGGDGRSIELRYLRTHPDDGTWGLSEPTAYAQFSSTSTPTTFAGGPIVHLAWAATGNPDLAVIDAVGRISILAFPVSLNRPFPLRSWESDPVDDLNAVVGCYWLPVMPMNKQYNMIYGPAVREEHPSGGVLGNGKYRYETTVSHAFGPSPPNLNKSALVCVTAGGRLRLLFTQNNNAMQDTSIELEGVTSSDDLATHASISNEKGTLLIALTTASRQLKVIRAAINWNNPQSQDKQVPPHAQQQNPILQHKPAVVTTWLQYGNLFGESQLDVSCGQISHVEVLPSALPPVTGSSGSNQQQQSWAPPVIMTIRTYIPTPSTAPYTPEARSIIDRWELLVDTPRPALHPAFAQLGFRPPANAANANGSNGQTRLNKLEPIVLNKVIVKVSTMHHGKMLCFAFSDGTVQYRDRFTMAEMYTEPNLAHISTLQQVHFRFVNPQPCVSVAFSPTNCSFAMICEDGKVKWNNLTYQGPALGPDSPDEYAAITAGLTTAISTASYNQIAYDDILSIARQFLNKPRFSHDWMVEIVRLLKINVDYSAESHHEQLVRNNALNLSLSVMNHLGFQGEFKRRAFCGKFAKLTLSVRNIVILITISSNTPVNLRVNPLDEPDVVDALAGCTKWALDFLAYICDSLFNLRGDERFMEYLSGQRNFSELIDYLVEKNEVVMHLVLCSSTRGFLSAACRRLAHLESISTRATQYYDQQQQQQQAAANGAAARRPALIQSYQKMQQYTASSMIKISEFAKLLATLGEDIRQTYQAQAAATQEAAGGADNAGKGKDAAAQGAQPTDPAAVAAAPAKRLQAYSEITLLLGSNPPASFQPVLLRFFRETVQAMRVTTDPAKLYFADYSLLEVAEDDDYSLQQQQQSGQPVYVDVFKRVVLAPRTPQQQQRQALDETAQQSAAAGGGSGQHPTLVGPTGLWRRCVRCTAVMEDMAAVRPGYTFVLAQQRKCSCSGNWALLPRGWSIG